MWNSVGGKIEESELHPESVIKETYEETGIKIDNPIYAVWSNRRNLIRASKELKELEK